MADKLLVDVWTNCPKGSTELAILQAIAEAANEQGNCYANLDDLASAARLSYRSAHRALKQLREERWVLASRVLGQGGRLVYQLNLPKLRTSERRNHDAARIQAQRARPTGSTEASLLERIAVRDVAGCQAVTSKSPASDAGHKSESGAEQGRKGASDAPEAVSAAQTAPQSGAAHA